jgi:hypothetical protein
MGADSSPRPETTAATSMPTTTFDCFDRSIKVHAKDAIGRGHSAVRECSAMSPELTGAGLAYPLAMEESWASWWEGRGRAQLELLLWALWDPIGTVPLDEYKSYCDPVVQVLRELNETDAPLAERAALDKQAQLQRNALYKTSVERLAELLAHLRTSQMQEFLDTTTERHAAEKLLDWYHWEMGVGIPAYLIPLEQPPAEP